MWLSWSKDKIKMRMAMRNRWDLRRRLRKRSKICSRYWTISIYVLLMLLRIRIRSSIIFFGTQFIKCILTKFTRYQTYHRSYWKIKKGIPFINARKKGGKQPLASQHKWSQTASLGWTLHFDEVNWFAELPRRGWIEPYEWGFQFRAHIVVQIVPLLTWRYLEIWASSVRRQNRQNSSIFFIAADNFHVDTMVAQIYRFPSFWINTWIGVCKSELPWEVDWLLLEESRNLIIHTTSWIFDLSNNTRRNISFKMVLFFTSCLDFSGFLLSPSINF